MSTELINRLTDEYRGDLLTLTTEEIRSVVENVVEKTKKHIAKRVVETRKGMIEILLDQGFFGEEDVDVEELILEALQRL